MNRSTWSVVAGGAAALTIACGSFALGAAMASDGSGPAPAAPSADTSGALTTVAGSVAPGAATTDPAGPSASAAPGGSGEAVTIVGFAFGPAELSVAAGSTITWTNDDDVPHSVVSADAVLSSPDMDQGATYEATLDTPGTVDYYCGIHQYMQATITVTE